MQHAVAIAAFSDAVSCDKFKKLVWCQVLLYPGQSGGKETDLNSWKFSFEVLSPLVLSQFLVGFSQGPKLLLKPC